ncbi:MAG: hypothetical protein KU29_04460 [Sulfurovum sp. FS06-10]|nr:MAG: hypothetical protein KU29_04460 [Sulfurovum sp. FS06-10]
MSSSTNNTEVIEAEVVPNEQGKIITGDELVAMIDISAQLPVISSNFKIIKTHVLTGLKEFEVKVTLDNIDKAKVLATSLNQLSNKAEEHRVNAVRIVSEPINIFNARCKEIIELIQRKRKFILDQVEVFNKETRNECLELLKSALATAYYNYGVTEEFKTAKVDDLAIVSNKTKTGITSKAKSTVEARALECKRFQEKVELRLNTLEATCYKFGLEAPLVRQNIESFLKVEDEAIYQQKLQSLIKSEIQCLASLEQRLAAKAQKEAEEKAKAEFLAQQKSQEPAKVQIESNSQPQIIIAKAPISQSTYVQSVAKPTGNQKTYVVTATFEVTVDEAMADKLEAHLLRKFEQACIKNKPTITITEKGAVKVPEAKKDSRSNLEEGSLF